MHREARRLTIACLTLTLLNGPAMAEEFEEMTLASFGDGPKLDWQTVNDNVMGGVSRGGYSFDDEAGILVFSGETSLRNNGGFSSIRSRSELDLSDHEGIAVRVRGDGRDYKVTMRGTRTGRMTSFWAPDFETRPGTWIELRIPFEEFYPTAFGRRLSRPDLDTSEIASIGFMIYDKEAGPFRLEVDSIRAYRKRASGPETLEGLERPSDIVTTAAGAGSFRSLLAAAESAGLADTLASEGPFTVFAPRDAAFAALGDGIVESLLEPERVDELRAILAHHVVPGRVGLGELLRRGSVVTSGNQRLTIGIEGGKVFVDGASLLTADIDCTNGVVHVIDRVLMPTSDTVLDVARKSEGFEKLVAAIGASGLTEVLGGAGPFTVLAPTDEAFASLPDGLLQTLLRPDRREALVQLLERHVIAGRVDAASALEAGQASTLDGTPMRFAVVDGRMTAGGSMLIGVDLEASNGIVHVIDRVLVPDDLQLSGAEPTRTRMARRLIELAIDRGVPIFNAGHHGACRAIYRVTIEALLRMDGGAIGQSTRDRLRRATTRSSRQPNREAAWTLRRALDEAHEELIDREDASIDD